MNKIITIGRECGSGGRSIAQKLAGALSIPFYDRKLIEMAANETGLSEEFVQQAEEKTGSLLYNLYFSSRNLPLSDQVFIAQSKVIRQLADQGPCVIVGRCSDYVLRGRQDCVHIFIHAPAALREARVIRDYGVIESAAAAFVQKQDRRRAAYYNHFADGRWGDSRNYDLSLNSRLGENAVLRILLGAVKEEVPQ